MQVDAQHSKRYISSKPVHRFCNLGEILDKAAVEITESKEALDVLFGFWNRPFDDALDLDRVHGHLVVRNDHAEVFDLRFLKLAFFWLEVLYKLFSLKRWRTLYTNL
jgi:hypothetical protein